MSGHLSMPAYAALPYSINAFFVILSFAVAVLGAYTALAFMESFTMDRLQLRAQQNGTALAAAAAAVFSISVNCVWTMHFLATSAVTWGNMATLYDLGQTLLSLVYIALGCVIGFLLFCWHSRGVLSNSAVKQQSSPFIQLLYTRPADSEPLSAHLRHLLRQGRAAVVDWRLWVGGTIIGIGVFAMHHTGMAATRIRAMLSCDPYMIFIGSPIIAIVAGSALLFVCMTMHGFKRRIIGAVVLGVATSLVHYYGYASCKFYPLDAEQWSMISWAGEVLIDAKVACCVVLLISSLIRFAMVGLISTSSE